MSKKYLILSLIFSFLFASRTFALNAPSVASVPSTVDADFYTFTVYVTPGAKVNVVGGPSFIPPETDDDEDGEVQVLVGLAQEQTNVFAISAEFEGEFSDSIEVTINESSGGGGGPVAPDAPSLDAINNPVEAYEYTITGSTSPNFDVFARRTDGSVAGTDRADGSGNFSITVDLEPGKTNRINVSVENAEQVKSASTQAVIQAVQPTTPPPAEEEEEEDEIPEVMEKEESKVVFFPFQDLDGHWAKNYVKEIYEKGIVSGKSATAFEPNANITRAELTKIAINAFGYNPVESLSEKPFTDVPTTAWFAPFVEKAKVLDIVSGYDDGFRPNAPITRAAALKILLEASGLEIGAGGLSIFDDVSSNAWFEKYVSYAQVTDIVSGYADGSFGPGRSITRAQVAKVVSKILELKASQ